MTDLLIYSLFDIKNAVSDYLINEYEYIIKEENLMEEALLRLGQYLIENDVKM